MRKINLLLLLTAFVFSLNAFAAEKVIRFNKNTTPGQRQASITMLGGKVLEDMPEIYAVLAEFPDNSTIDVKDIEGLRRSNKNIVAADENPYVLWLNQTAPLKRIGSAGQNSGLKQINTTKRPPTPTATIKDFDQGEILMQAAKQQVMPWGVERVNAPKAWAKGLTGKGVVVAVIDTGIKLEHPDLKDNIKGGKNTHSSRKSPEDDQGHGTHVAGTIAALNNDKGVVGVAPEAKLLAVKALDSYGGGKMANVAKGILWAVKNGAHVINMSLGQERNNDALQAAVEYALSKNVIIVASSGNDGYDLIQYPAAYKGVIVVGASDINNKKARFSNYGPHVTFIAPGQDIVSTYLYDMYSFNSGTSMSTPCVAGLAALAVQAGAKTPKEVVEMLKKASTSLKMPKTHQGFGLVDAALIGG